MLIQPGEYYDCAIVRQSNITIAGTGPGVVMTDTTCAGKAILVTSGRNITIRGLTLQRARVPDGNGAGIRAQGDDLTIDNVRFLNNEDGILAADAPDSTIRIVNSDFERNGVCNPSARMASTSTTSSCSTSSIRASSTAHRPPREISRRRAPCLIGDTIEDGPKGTASYLVDIPNGGSVLMQGCTLEKGPNAENHSTAVVIGEEGRDQPTRELMFRDNRSPTTCPIRRCSCAT